MTPSNYDEAQERLEELRDRISMALDDVLDGEERVRTAESILASRQMQLEKLKNAYLAQLEKIAAEAAAEKAVRGGETVRP